ncbi:MAG TPA: hypothetical protein VNZ94_00305 [Xanthobacteraceae bacterium]|nr:hypothetical protein [Xanthobacteraceae bacterium]
MGYNAEFLIGQNAPSNLPDAIADLEDASIVFLDRWGKGDVQRAGDVSKKAMVLLDFIVNELLRECVERKGLGTYLNSQLATEMSVLCGIGVTGTSLADQQMMCQAGIGNGRVAAHLGSPEPITLAQLLNKVKHRNRHLINFRIDNDRHIFVICPEHTSGGAEGIYEFDVEEFCEKCRSATSAL